MVTQLWATPSSEIYRKIEKLNSTGSVLYFAAHPDDENTALLYFLSQERKLDTAYLSLTRGDGGQNRVGPELGKELGMIRTQELLGARKYDWSRQFFSHAVDFGYSKTVRDTLQFWEEEKVLEDAVYLIRKFRPDLIITRFDPERGGTHGHHTASAMLALKAFNLAADASAFPEQLKEVEVHQTRQICWDSYRRSEDADSESIASVEVSMEAYDELLGASTMEFSRLALASNKSQGTVFATDRRNRSVRLEWLGGESMDTFSIHNLPGGWNSSESEIEIGTKLATVLDQFDFLNPSQSLGSLLEVRSLIDSMEPSVVRTRKMQQLERILGDLLGLFVEVRTSSESVVPGNALAVTVELVNRSSLALTAETATFTLFDSSKYPERIEFQESILDAALAENEPFYKELELSIPVDAAYTQPYWIENDIVGNGMFDFDNRKLMVESDNPPSIVAHFQFELEGVRLDYQVPVVEHRTDIFEGEVKTPVSIVPAVSVSFSGGMELFTALEPKTLQLEVRAAEVVSGELQLEAESGWELSWTKQVMELQARESSRVAVELTPSNQNVGQRSQLKAKFVAGDDVYEQETRRIEYPHIETQAWLAKTEIPVVHVDVKRHQSRIAYVQGAGDKIPEGLKKLGYSVDELTLPELQQTDLTPYEAVIFGIRVYNVNDGVDQVVEQLQSYVKGGGIWLVQYNTAGGYESPFNAPFPITLSRQRVSEETAEVSILQPEHPLLSYPNRISSADFEGWVQERGLYFANEWDEAYTPLLSSHDFGEDPQEGGLLVAELGEGRFIYTGYSFFRQIPAGVPGALRLFVNLISKSEK